MNKKLLLSVAGMFALTTHLSGCVTNDALLSSGYGSGSGAGRFPAGDPNDSCNMQFQALSSDYEYFEQPLVAKVAAANTQRLIQGVGQGMVTSMLVGGRFDAGSLVENTMQDFAQEMISAALSEATRSYLTQAGATSNGDYGAVWNRLDSDAAREAGRLSQVGSKVVALQNCRDQQIKAIDRDYARKRISASQARQGYDQVQSYVRRDSLWIEKLTGQSSERVYVFEEADEYVSNKLAGSSSQGTKPSNRSAPRKSSGAKKRGNASVAKAKTEQKRVEVEQKKIAKLDQVLENRKSGLPT